MQSTFVKIECNESSYLPFPKGVFTFTLYTINDM